MRSDARRFLQPFHADGDVDQRVLQREQILGAAKARVPAEKAETARGEIGRDVVLGEIDVVVRGDDRGLGRVPCGVQ